MNAYIEKVHIMSLFFVRLVLSDVVQLTIVVHACMCDVCARNIKCK